MDYYCPCIHLVVVGLAVLNMFATINPVMRAMTLITNGVPLSGIPGYITKMEPMIKPIIIANMTLVNLSNKKWMALLLTIKPTMTPAPMTIIIGKFNVESALMAVAYTPNNSKTNDPLTPGKSIAILPAQPAKNKPIVFCIVNDVITLASAGLMNAVDAKAAPTTSNKRK